MDSPSRLKEIVNVETTADGFCDFFTILFFVVIGSLPQSLVRAAGGGGGPKYVDLHLVLFWFSSEVPTPP